MRKHWCRRNFSKENSLMVFQDHTYHSQKEHLVALCKLKYKTDSDQSSWFFHESWVQITFENPPLRLETLCPLHHFSNAKQACSCTILGCDPVRFHKVSNTRHWRGDLFKAKPDSTGGGADDPVIDVLCLQVTAELKIPLPNVVLGVLSRILSFRFNVNQDLWLFLLP